MEAPVVEELSFEVSGLRLAAKAWGKKDGRPVLALHGWLDNAATFDRLAPLLDPALRIVAVDLPGHGASQHRSLDAGYAIPDAVLDVCMLIHRLGWPRCVLLGHSMGGAIATILAGTEPERVDKLVLIEGLGPLTEEAEDAPRRLHDAISEAQRRGGGSKTRVFESIDAAAERVVAAAPMQLSSARVLLERGLTKVVGGYTWRTDPRARSTTRLRFSEAHVAAFMRRIGCETLLVRAEDGWPVPPELAALRKGYVERLTELIVPGNHHVHLDAPELIAPHINEFLRN